MLSLTSLLNDVVGAAVFAGLSHLAIGAVGLGKRLLARDRAVPILSSNHTGPTRSERIEASLAKRRLAAADIAWIGQLAH
jgi:hypothetical protein